MKILFFGTPKFGADVLNELINSKHEVIGAVCQTDKKGNRNKLEICEVKRIAVNNSIPVYQFENVNEHAAALKNLGADIFVTAAYGQILSRGVIYAPAYGTVNVHPSLLPKYRGAAPVQAALLSGDKVTGVTVAKTAEKTDSGDILAYVEIEISAEDDCAALLERTAKLGGRLLVSVLDDFDKFNKNALKQDESKASYAAKTASEACRLDFSRQPEEICNRIRALSPEPGAFCDLKGDVLKVFKAEALKGNLNGVPGEVIKCDKSGLHVKCAGGAVSLLSVLAAGGKVLHYKDFINGRKIVLGDILK